MTEPTSPAAASNRRIWNDPRVRALVFQVVALAAVIWFGWSLFSNTLSNMDSRGISTGFGFLDQPAGFGIVMSLLPYDETMSYGRTFWVGLLNTLLVSGLGIVLATILGFVIGIARLSSNWLVAKIALAYIEIVRNIPLLLQIFFWYFAVLRTVPSPRESLSLGDLFFLNNRGLYMPRADFLDGAGWLFAAVIVAVLLVFALRFWAGRRQDRTGRRFPVLRVSLALLILIPGAACIALGVPVGWELPALKGFNFRGGIVIIPELAALLAALTIYTAAFIAETVRSGILAVSHGQTEAAQALGLRRGVILRRVVIPQAMRVIVPPLTSQYLNLTKNSSLATAIGYPDLVAVFMGTTLNQTGQAVEIVAMTMAVYLVISLVISLVMNIYNRAVALEER